MWKFYNGLYSRFSSNPRSKSGFYNLGRELNCTCPLFNPLTPVPTVTGREEPWPFFHFWGLWWPMRAIGKSRRMTVHLWIFLFYFWFFFLFISMNNNLIFLFLYIFYFCFYFFIYFNFVLINLLFLFSNVNKKNRK